MCSRFAAEEIEVRHVRTALHTPRGFETPAINPFSCAERAAYGLRSNSSIVRQADAHGFVHVSEHLTVGACLLDAAKASWPQGSDDFIGGRCYGRAPTMPNITSHAVPLHPGRFSHLRFPI